MPAHAYSESTRPLRGLWRAIHFVSTAVHFVYSRTDSVYPQCTLYQGLARSHATRDFCAEIVGDPIELSLRKAWTGAALLCVRVVRPAGRVSAVMLTQVPSRFPVGVGPYSGALAVQKPVFAVINFMHV